MKGFPVLQTILQVAGFLVLTLTNVAILAVSYKQLDDELVYDTYRLKFTAAFHGLQILAALVLWYYSEADGRNWLLLWLILVPASGILYCLVRLGKTERYRHFVMFGDMAGAAFSLLVMAVLIWS